MENLCAFTGRDIIIAHSIEKKGDFASIVDALKLKAHPSFEAMKKATNLKCKAVTILDEDYPKALRDAVQPPLVLYYSGNLNLLSDCSRCITVVGSRDPSDYALEETRRICKELASDGYIIVSGLAKGIDAAAHEGAIKYGKTVAFLGNGIDVYYPSVNLDLQKQIASDGLLISEYPPGTSPCPKHFPARNRLITMCGEGVLVGAALPRSGTSISVALALYYGKEVGCLPERSTAHSYCNQLIKEGAYLIEDKEDVIAMISRSCQ